ncbi:HNH endonuclease [Fervidobacterium changbaicum]|uniref:RNA-guided endonuclease IscB n=1 Tax=Fervidobacterium changbaicum TaxID=310769 RepID=UPI00088FDAA8|nr:RNA-guided endonuclease IscB [Fervidobacterium changbaicum]SDG92073.1 HNH endonuclease [Fervidobacterium changbaicum]
MISKDGKPLMPTKRHGKVRRLLKQGLAKVVNREPFTIQLLYETTNYTQPVTVGIDIGSKVVGVCAVTDKEEMFSAEIQLRQDISKLLLERRQHRRFRRYRKTRYRKPRFLNRRKEDGWLPPSLQWKVDAHVRIVNKLSKIIPITKVVVEVAPFDIQKVQNPDIEGEDYQNGPQKGFADVREYCLWRAGYKSELSGKTGVLEVHHIIPRSEGGADTPSNLIVLTTQEHKMLHEGKIKIPKSRLEQVKVLKDAAHVSAIGWYIVNKLKQNYQVAITYGSITKARRATYGLEKSHRDDAFVIAGGNIQERANEWYFGKLLRRQNRSLHKANPIKGGKRPLNTIKQVKGFRRFDRVECEGKIGIVSGLRSSGYFSISSLNGEKISDSVKYTKLRLLERAKTLMFERRERATCSWLKPRVSVARRYEIP